MTNQFLVIKDLHASIEGKKIIKGLNLEINKNEVHVIMGPNGAGKSTLANIIMGHPSYEVTKGNIYFNGEDITDLRTDERAKKGLFLSFQMPEEIPGITMENFLRTAKTALSEDGIRAYKFHNDMLKKMKDLEMGEEYSKRYVNVGFSGGERKKSEIFQMLMLEPKLAILDETDSGLDVDAIKTVSKGILDYKNKENALIIITHNTKLLENLPTSHVHILADGKIIKSGDYSLVEQINTKGFTSIESVN